MRKITVLLTLVMIFFHSGCKTAPIIGVLGSPTSREKKIPAEYDLTERTEQKVLVLVDQPAWLGSDVNLRYYLTDVIRKNLVERIEFPEENLVSYDELSKLRSGRTDFSSLLPAEIGKALKADIVLLVMIESYQLDEIAQSGYHEGFLGSQAVLIDTATGKKLWPETDNSKSIRVGFEADKRGKEVAVARLVTASAYCTVRYLFNCQKNRFRIADDRSHPVWQKWQ